MKRVYAGPQANLKTTPNWPALLDQFTGAGGHGEASTAPKAKPGLGIGFLAVLLPAILMLANTIGETLFAKGSTIAKITDFLGEPLVAMLFSVLFASITLVYMRGGDTEKLRESLGASLKQLPGAESN